MVNLFKYWYFRLAVYVLIGVALGELLPLAGASAGWVMVAQLALVVPVVALAVRARLRRTVRVRPLTPEELTAIALGCADAQCRYCGRAAAGALKYFTPGVGRPKIYYCSKHVGFAIAEATR